ncbi:uncharacterized protein Z518_10557 [Rhinocladiella mackenziei CBS 650.93]|uniref:Major facilitator superfamily (MFS) profile domain-containing protein n=1 Tax=Rhinocladiella mackenziei CBS 650.93 TaxID=1442369 RepID=A0A0D2GQ12_9EURO|nr:uncharacterized protein Z518_10557 [Rhinocladiella mackenziei CBS 650.93]KIX00418.1 hypothetical protein Z518_10557 [Rhinocladiella mackenziei CBS 650.93]
MNDVKLSPVGHATTTTSQDQPPELHSDAESLHSEPESIQPGVQKAILLKKAWSPISLTIAFTGLLLTTLVLILSDYSQSVYDPYVTSSFKQHSALSAAKVVNNISRICAFPIIAKLSDTFGRAEMFTLSLSISTICFVLYATSQNIGQYFVSGIFDAIGGTGFLIMQQVFVADATNLVNRAFWSTLPETVTNLPAMYVGTIIGENLLTHSTWRWGYGIWAIVTPFAAIPLVVTMFVLQQRARRHGLWVKSLASVANSKDSDPFWKKTFHLIWTELDFLGMFLLTAGLSLLLIPLALTGSFNPDRWKEASFIAMFVLGFVLIGFFVAWDLKFARKPLMPYQIVKDRTVIAGCLIQILDFMGHSLFNVFFSSYLQVAPNYPPGQAVRIDNSLRVAFQIVALLAAVGMKYTKRTQMWVLMGPPCVLIGQGVSIYIVNNGGGQGNEAAFVAARVAIGIGRALLQTGSQVAVQAVVSRQQVAVATGIFQASTTIGGAFGTSIAGAIWRNTLPNKLLDYLPQEDRASAAKIFQSLPTAKSFEPGTPARDAIDQAYRESQQLLGIAATAISAPNLIIMWFMRNIKLDEESEQDKIKVDNVVEKLKRSTSVPEESERRTVEKN